MSQVRVYEQAMFFVGNSFRKSLSTQSNRFPWHQWVRLVYNDALTYDPATGNGGVRAAWRHRAFGNSPLNKALLGYANHLENLKANETMTFDKCSIADYSVGAAFTAIQMAEGPVMLDDFAWGRQDATSEAQCGSLSGIPSPNNYIARLEELGFDHNEIVALANCESFGIDQSAGHARWSNHPKFNNHLYKYLLTGSGSSHRFHDILMNNPSTREHVQNFAENNAEFHLVFKRAFARLSELGSDSNSLSDIEHFLHDDPNSKLFYPNEYGNHYGQYHQQ